VEVCVRKVLDPHWHKQTISKEQYKDIVKKSIEKVTSSKETSINHSKIKSLVEQYVEKYSMLNK